MIFLRYTLRNLFVQKAATFSAVLAVAATVAVTTAMLAFIEGVQRVLRQTGRPENALVLAPGALSELESTVPLTVINRVKLSDALAREADEPLASTEVTSVLVLRELSGQGDRRVTLRGVDPLGFKVHGVRLLRGRMPQTGERGLLMGVRQQGQLEGLAEGGSLVVGRHLWPVVGVIAAEGTMFESEVWADRTALMSELRREQPSKLAVVLSGESAQEQFGADVSRNGEGKAVAVSERDYFRRMSEDLGVYLNVVLVAIGLLGFGAIFACAGSLYTSAMARVKELATLLSLGFRRERVAALIVQEGLLLAAVGALFGVPLALLALSGLSEVQVALGEVSFASGSLLSPRVLLAGLLVGGFTGFIGSVVPALQVFRLDIIASLRD